MEDKIKRYYELKSQIRSLEHECNKLNKEIKDYMIRQDCNKFTLNGYSVDLKIIDSRKFKEEAIVWLKKNGYRDLVEETVNKKLVRKYIESKKIDKEIVNSLKEGLPILALYIKKVKGDGQS